MKKIVLGFLFFSYCVIANAQSLVTGRVIDKLSREPLELAFAGKCGMGSTGVYGTGILKTGRPMKINLLSQRDIRLQTSHLIILNQNMKSDYQ